MTMNSPTIIRKVLDQFRENSVNDNGKTIEHVRLGDFFENEEEEVNYLNERMHQLERGSHIIINRDTLFEKEYVVNRLKELDIVHINTSSYTNLDLLLLMSDYSKIMSNVSSLAGWVALLGKKELVLGYKELSDCILKIQELETRY